MKTIRLFLGVILLLVASLNVKAQATSGTQAPGKSNYFVGKWDVLLKGLPSGDTRMIVSFERKDTALVATLQDSTGTEAGEVNKVIENAESVTVYFVAQGYNVDLLLEKKDADHVTGSLMSMFDVTGDRIKDTKTK